MILPKETMDLRRQEHTRLRRRLLEGDWGGDLSNYIAAFIDPHRQASWGIPSQSVNLFKSVVGQVSVLYDEQPVVRNPDMTPEQDEYLRNLNVFALHQKHEKYVKGLRESAIRIEYQPESHLGTEGVRPRLVTPDNLVVYSSSLAPGVPVRIEETRYRTHPVTQREGTYVDVWDISDPAAPYFMIVTTESNPVDCTDVFAPEMTEYPFVDDKGPFLPWVIYHAQETGALWDPYDWSELVWATLDIGLLHTFFKHVVREASWQQKYGLDVDLAGKEITGNGDSSRDRVSVDPASILLFNSKDTGGSLGTFAISGEPDKIIDAIQKYQLGIAQTLGLGSSDAQDNPQSGVALTIRRDGVRELQKKYVPTFRKADIEYLECLARINNIFSSTQLPTSMYQITYTSIPMSQEEMTTKLDRLVSLQVLGIVGKVDILLAMEPNLTRQEALIRLEEIRKENLQLS